MNASDFRCPDAGRVVRTPSGYTAFVPSPLPPRIEYDESLVGARERADAALGELSGFGRYLPNPHLLIASYVRREAVLSSRIEGTRVGLSELVLGEVAPPSPESDAEQKEVHNYVIALERGIERLRGGFPLSLRLVRDIHERLMEGVRGEHATPGEFRRSQHWIGPAGSTPQTAPYVPPPVAEMTDLLGDWERYLHRRDDTPDLIRCALMHEQFEAIHPFLDRNGRVGRLLITLFLIDRGRLSQPLLYLSAYIEAHRQDYYDLLQRVRTEGDWNSWIRFFLTGMTETARTAVKQAARIMDLREDLRERLRNAPRALGLVDALFVNPYLNATRARQVLGVSDPTARQAMRVLEELGLLELATRRLWRRVYVARPILRAREQVPVDPSDADAAEV